jgi:predicted esterase YcpF (UPF0227 family)
MKKTLIYFHGFGSSGQSQTVNYLKKLMPDCEIIAPDIPVDPKEALPFLRSLCEAEKPDLVIGTSMGAMYAMQMLGCRRICVNPALRMSELTDILKVGTFNYFQPPASGKTNFTITEEIIQHFRDMEQHLYDGLTDESRRLCWGFFGDEDDTVNYKEEFQRQFYPHIISFHGGHRMNNAILREVIVPFAKMLINEEQTDEWGVTYSSYGRILKNIDPKRFTCEEYAIPEGVEVMEGTFWLHKYGLRKIQLPKSLRKINYNAFLGCPIEAIEFPEGITEIPGSACEVCRELKVVRLPSTITEIGIGAFNGCEKLEEINLPDGILYMEDNVFSCCRSLKHVTLPKQLRWIAPELFNSSGIESITIPNNITEIGYWAFWGCDNLKSLTIPESVTKIGSGIVSAHEGFEGVVCHAPGYHVENEALIEDETGTMLCCWTTQKDYVVPECVKRIADFSLNDFVETITVKQYVEIECHETFAANHNLKKIDFQGGVGGECENIMDMNDKSDL